MKVSLGRNISYGLLFFILVGIVSGLGILLNILMSPTPSGNDPSAAFSMIFQVMGNLLTIPIVATILALIVGILQGKLAMNKKDALISGAVTGAIGTILLLFIIIGLLYVTFTIKGGTATASNAEFDVVGAIKQFILTLVPSAILGSVSAFLSIKYIFPVEELDEKATKEKTTITTPPRKEETTTSQQKKIYKCPKCGEIIEYGENPCHSCGTYLKWP